MDSPLNFLSNHYSVHLIKYSMSTVIEKIYINIFELTKTMYSCFYYVLLFFKHSYPNDLIQNWKH